MATFHDWEAAVLRAIKAPVTKANIAFLDAWQRSEGGGATFNPLNTTHPAKGSTLLAGNSAGVRNYPSAAAGVHATAQTLTSGRFGAIVAALRSGNPSRYLAKPERAAQVTHQLSVWGSHTYAAQLAPSSGFTSSPVAGAFTFGRIDQGVDVNQGSPYRAVGAGRIYAIGGFGGGSDTAVYEQLRTPITVAGRTYRDVYYAETAPLVKVGQRVRAGQPVTGPGSAELGFAAGAKPAAPLIGGLGPDTKPTKAGAAYAAALSRSIYESEQYQTQGGNPALSALDAAATTALPYIKVAGYSAEAVAGVPGALPNAVGGAAAIDASHLRKPSGLFSGLESWLVGTGKLVAAYVLVIVLAIGLFLIGLKGLGVKTPKLPATVPVPA